MSFKTARRYRGGKKRPKPQPFPTGEPKKKPKLRGLKRRKDWTGETTLDMVRGPLRKKLSKIPIDKRPHVSEFENEDLTIKGLRRKISAAIEGHEDKEFIKMLQRDFVNRLRVPEKKKIDLRKVAFKISFALRRYKNVNDKLSKIDPESYGKYPMSEYLEWANVATERDLGKRIDELTRSDEKLVASYIKHIASMTEKGVEVRKYTIQDHKKHLKRRKPTRRPAMFGDWEHQEYYEKLLNRGVPWAKARRLTKEKFPEYDPEGYQA